MRGGIFHRKFQASDHRMDEHGLRKRVAIVGAGASGMAAAWSLSRFPDRYEVDVFEPSSVAGGVACTLKHEGASVNYGVQGGSPAAHQNTVELMRAFGIEVSPTRLDVSFGKGQYNWKNFESKPLQKEMVSETRRFGTVLRWISRLEFLSIFISIDLVLRVLRFSETFRHRMVYPLVALFVRLLPWLMHPSEHRSFAQHPARQRRARPPRIAAARMPHPPPAVWPCPEYRSSALATRPQASLLL